MSFKPNTIPVPREIVLGVAEGKFYPQDVYYAALRMAYPRQEPEAIAEKFDIKYTWKVDNFFNRAAGNSGGSYQQKKKEYPESPPAPEGFKEQAQQWIDDEVPGLNPLTDSTANAIYEKAGGDEELVQDAILLMADYHKRGSEVKSPAGVIINTLTVREPSVIREDADKVRNGGTMVGNRERRMSRALERTEEYARASGYEPQQDDSFLSDEG